MSKESAEEAIEGVYEANEGSEIMEQYHARHDTLSMLILTIGSAYAATREVDQFWRNIKGKTVIEIGAGAGFLALEMAKFAKQVYAIEVDPSWSAVFTEHLYEIKPPNLTWIFGKAQTVAPFLRGDVAVVFTRSDRKGMEAIARQMCPTLIAGPNLRFDERFEDIPREILEAAQKIANALPLGELNRRGIVPK